jgi:carboxylate-amine ligase
MKEKEHVFSIGIEEEFQIVDPETRELRSHIREILAQGKLILKEQVKPEMHQSVVELGTEICRDVVDARQQVVGLRRELAGSPRSMDWRSPPPAPILSRTGWIS